jgi:polysaccharide biosynthesis protein PslG
MHGMRRAPIPSPLVSALVGVALLCVPAAAAAKPGQTEHGVDRAKLAQKAEKRIEERRGIEVLKISRCGPVKRKGRPIYSKWDCFWRAEGIWPGEVPYHCAGKARWKRKGNRWRVDQCVNRLQPMAPLLASPNPHPTFGFNDDWIFESEQAFDLLAETGAQVARTALPWSGVEADRGQFNWHGTDVMYDRLVSRGVRPVWSLLAAPCWAQGDPGKCANGNDKVHPAPAKYGEMAQFAVRVARRYPLSAGIEVWNEPNYPRFWGGWPEPERYAQMFKQVADALHRETPGMPVVTAGLSPHADSDKTAIGYSNFLDALYKHGAAQKADAIGIHPYPSVAPGQDYVGDVRVYLGKIQRVMRKHHDSDRPMWATEFGVSTAGPKAFAADHQARAIVELYDILRRVNRVDLAIVHRFVEDPELGGREAGFGVVSENLVPKPAYCAVIAARGTGSRRC